MKRNVSLINVDFVLYFIRMLRDKIKMGSLVKFNVNLSYSVRVVYFY